MLPSKASLCGSVMRSQGLICLASGGNPMSTSQRLSFVFSAVVVLIVPTLLWAGEDKEAVLAKCRS